MKDMARIITLAMAVYGQPQMLDVWFNTLRTYPEEVLQHLELAIGDDHGDPPAEIPEDIQEMLPCKLLRAKEDIPWNQPGMRNLLLDTCDTPLILFVDPDMVFPVDMMRRMIEAGDKLPRKEVIRFMLKHRGSGQLDGTSPNTWFLHVEDFLAIGGYDEDYCGNKGWSDVQLLDVMKTYYKLHHRADLFADFYSTEEVPDAMVQSLTRSHKENRVIRVKKCAWARRNGGWKALVKAKRSRVRFEWEKVL